MNLRFNLIAALMIFAAPAPLSLAAFAFGDAPGTAALAPGQSLDESFETDPTEGKPSESGNPHTFGRADGKWTIHNSPFFLWDTGVARTGNASVRLGKVQGHVILSTRPVPVKPGEFVEATVWARTQDADGRTYLSLSFSAGGQQLTEIKGGSPYGSVVWQLQPLGGGTRNWSPMVARGRVPAGADAVAVNLVTLDNTSGFAWFDDLRIRNLPAEEWKGELLGQPQWIDPESLKPDDYVTVRQNHLSYKGQRLRIWSSYAATSIMPETYGDADREIRRFKAMGFNAMRSLWWDMEVDDDYQLGDGSVQDRRDYLIASLGRHGIFLWNDLLNSCQIRPDKVNVIDDPSTADAWTEAIKQVVGDGGHAEVRAFIPVATDPRCEKIYHEYIKKVLAHRNKHNGLTYAEDPAIFNWELMNEDWWIMRVLWGDHLGLPEFFQKQIYDLWNRWLREKYGSSDRLAKAWGKLLPGESLEKSTVLLLPLAGEAEADKLASVLGLNVKFAQPKYSARDFARQRGGDVVHFLVDANIASKQRAEKVFRAQGRPGLGSRIVPLIYDTGYSGGVLPFYMHSFSSATAAATYLDMSTHDRNQSTFPFASGLDRPPALNNWIDSRRLLNKPAFVYEIMTFNPQKYRAEFPYRLLALLAIQDYDVVSFHAYGHPLAYWGIEDPHTAHALEYMSAGNNWNGTTLRSDEVLMSACRVAGEIFKRGYLEPARDPAVVTLGTKTMWSLDGMGGGQYASAADRTVWHRGFRWAFNPKQSEDKLSGGRLISPVEHEEPVIQPTGQITYRWHEGIMVIDDPRAKALVGFVPEEFSFEDGMKLTNISVHNPPGMPFVVEGERYVAFSIASLDAQPLDRSKQIVLSAMSTSCNSGLKIDLRKMAGDTEYSWGLARSITDPGDLPVQVARVGATLCAPWLKGRSYRMIDFNENVLAQGTLDSDELTIPAGDLPVFLTEITTAPPESASGGTTP